MLYASFFIFFSFVPVAQFCQCSMHFYFCFFIFFVRVSVLQLFYAFLFILCRYISASFLVLPMLYYSLNVGFLHKWL